MATALGTLAGTFPMSPPRGLSGPQRAGGGILLRAQHLDTPRLVPSVTCPSPETP